MLCALSIVAAALTVREVISSSVDSRLEAARGSGVAALARFANYPDCFKRDVVRIPFLSRGLAKAEENPSFWARDVDWSCVSPWNDSTGALRAGTAVSPRHVVFATHFSLWPGVRMAFVDSEGNVCHCAVKKTRAVGTSDITVGLLDWELPPCIRPAKILPQDYAKYIGDGDGLPTVTFNRREEAVVNDFKPIFEEEDVALCSWMPTNDVRRGFQRKLESGDSGNPAFLVCGNEPILLYCLTGGIHGSGAGVHKCRREIQAAMDELAPGYRLEEFDFGAVVKRRQDDESRKR